MRRWLTILALMAPLAAACSDDDSGGVAVFDTSGAGGDTAVTEDATEDTAIAAEDTGVAIEDTGAAVDDTEAPIEDTGGAAEDTSAPADTAPATGPNLFADPEFFTFSYIAPLEAAMTKQLTLMNTGTSTLEITALEWAAGSSADFDLVLVPPLPKRLDPGKTTLLTVRFQDVEGGTGELLITSNDADEPVKTLTFASYLKASLPEPCVELTPSKLDFGQVVRGNTVTKTATLKNCGTSEPLELSQVTRSNFFFIELSQEFQITNLPALPHDIPAGTSIPIDVAYTPTLAGLDAGHFLFHTNDPEQPTAQLDVSAVGKSPPLEDIGLHIKLEWDTDDTDVDSHLIAPGGTYFDCTLDCFYANPNPDWGVQGDWVDDPFLDVDDVDGYGPENINISEPVAGTYTFKLHYFADSHEGMSQASHPTVEVRSYNQLLATFGPETLSSTNWSWDVFTIEWPSKTITTLNNVWQTPSSQINACGLFP